MASIPFARLYDPRGVLVNLHIHFLGDPSTQFGRLFCLVSIQFVGQIYPYLHGFASIIIAVISDNRWVLEPVTGSLFSKLVFLLFYLGPSVNHVLYSLHLVQRSGILVSSNASEFAIWYFNLLFLLLIRGNTSVPSRSRISTWLGPKSVFNDGWGAKWRAPHFIVGDVLRVTHYYRSLFHLILVWFIN